MKEAPCAAATPAIASVSHAGRLWRWVADPGRWPYKHHEEYAQRRGITEDGNNPERPSSGAAPLFAGSLLLVRGDDGPCIGLTYELASPIGDPMPFLRHTR